MADREHIERVKENNLEMEFSESKLRITLRCNKKQKILIFFYKKNWNDFIKWGNATFEGIRITNIPVVYSIYNTIAKD